MSQGGASLPPLEQVKAKTATIKATTHWLFLVLKAITITLHISDSIQNNLFTVVTTAVVFFPQTIAFGVGRTDFRSCPRGRIKAESNSRRLTFTDLWIGCQSIGYMSPFVNENAVYHALLFFWPNLHAKPTVPVADDRVIAWVGRKISDLQSRGIDTENGIVAHVSVEIRSTSKSDRIFIEKPARGRIVISRTVIIQPGLAVKFPPGEAEQVTAAARRLQ